MGTEPLATFEKEEVEKGDAIAWAAYHASQKRLHMGFQPCVQCYLCSMRSLLHTQD